VPVKEIKINEDLWIQWSSTEARLPVALPLTLALDRIHKLLSLLNIGFN